jgi:twitching motility protein PilT
MRDGDTEGMQHFDGEIEKMVRAGTVDFEAALSYSTNAGNLRLELADYLENPRNTAPKKKSDAREIEIER